MKPIFILILLFVSSCSSEEKGNSPALSTSKDYKFEKIYEAGSVVWSFDFVGEDKLIVSHRDGELFLFDVGAKKKTKLDAPKVYNRGQGGLLDVAYKSIAGKNYVYLTFSDPTKKGKAVTTLARGELKGGSLKGLKTIFRSNADGAGSIHFGSRMVFADESIFMTVGERGERDLAQSVERHNGSVLRLTFEGKAHPENPFVGKTGLDEIYSYGHRNPQGIDIDPVSKRLYAVEMGPRGGDELNLIEKGKNYGWPVITYGREYYGPKIGATKKEGMEQPVTYWVPSISPSGMAFYTGDKMKGYRNWLFLGCLSGTQVRALKLENNKVAKQVALFGDMDERFRHVRNGPDGYLYLSTDSGKIFKVSSK